jgi:hypothetical protein
MTRAFEALERATGSEDHDVRRRALACLAVLLRRGDRHEETAEAWQRILDLAPGRGPLSPLDRRAAEALAIHHEHRRKDLGAARRYAEALSREPAGLRAEDVERRLSRIQRKELRRRATPVVGRLDV